MDDRREAALAFIVIGGVLFAVGIGIGAVLRPWKWSPQQGARTVVGQVVGQRTKSDSESGLSFQPVVRYEVGGVSHEITGMGRTRPRYEVGAEVLVAYPPDQPSDGAIADSEEQWLPVMMFGGGGLFFMFIGWEVLKHERAKRRA